MDVAILVILIIVLIISIINFLLLLFVGSGAANQGEVIMDRQDEVTENLLAKFNSLDQEIRYRLPRKVYGAEPEDESSLTFGPDDSRIPR